MLVDAWLHPHCDSHLLSAARVAENKVQVRTQYLYAARAESAARPMPRGLGITRHKQARAEQDLP